MPTIKESLYFNYNGISCKTYNLMNVNVGGSGMFEETFHASRNINETKVKGNDTPLFNSIDEDPLQFQLTIAFTKAYTDADIDNIIVWLFQDNYKPLYFEDKPNKIYYCMPSGEAQIAHTGLKQGYLTVTMRCKSSKIYSPQQLTPLYDLSTNPSGGFTFSINNTGHEDIYPEISITKIDNGALTFTKDGEIFEIQNLTNLEQIYINCEKEIIETDAIGVSHYDDVIGDYFDMMLKLGNNTIKVEGTCKVQFRYVFKYKF
jgi:predicted phage tail component-like protein